MRFEGCFVPVIVAQRQKEWEEVTGREHVGRGSWPWAEAMSGRVNGREKKHRHHLDAEAGG
jgi:hypothetical protein